MKRFSNLLLENEKEADLNEQNETEFTLYFKKNLTRFNGIYQKVQGYSETLTAFSTISRSGRLLKLSRIQLKKFDGTPENWQTLLETFECAKI